MSHNARSRFLLGSSLSHFARGVALIASAFFILKASGNVVSVGGLFVLVTLPELVGSLLGGRLSDRWSKRKLAATADILRSIAALLLAGVAIKGSWTLPSIYLFNLLLALGDAFYIPASNTLLAQIAGTKDLARMNGHYEIATQLGNLLSVSIGGMLIDALGFQAALVMSGLAYFGSAAFIFSLPETDKQALAKQAQVLTVHWTVRFRSLAGMGLNPSIISAGIMFSLVRVILTMLNTLLVTIIVNDFKQSATMLGVTDALAALGVIFAGFTVRSLMQRTGVHKLMYFGFSCTALSMMVMPHFGLTGLMMITVVMTCFFGWGRVAARTELMRLLPTQTRGYYFGVFNALSVGLGAVSTLALSAATQSYDTRMGCAVAGLVVAAVTAIAAGIAHSERNRTANLAVVIR